MSFQGKHHCLRTAEAQSHLLGARGAFGEGSTGPPCQSLAAPAAGHRQDAGV